jgi:hypothetical protein
LRSCFSFLRLRRLAMEANKNLDDSSPY